MKVSFRPLKGVFNKINIITIIFLISIISLLFNVSWLLYGTLCLLFVNELVVIIKNSNLSELRIDKRLIPLLLMFMINLTVSMLTSYPIDRLSSCIKISTFYLLYILGEMLFYHHGREYLTEALSQITQVILTLSILGFVLHFVLRIQVGTSSGNLVYGDNQLTISTIMDPLRSRMMSVFKNPIIFADIALVAFVYELFRYGRTLYSFIKIAIYLSAIYFSSTRGAWISLLIVVLLYIMYNTYSYKDVAKTIFITIPIILILIGISFQTGLARAIESRFLQLNVDASYLQRIGAIQYFMDLILKDPINAIFGHGFGSAITVISKKTIIIDSFSAVDNGWISLTFDLGLIFCVLLLIDSAVCVVRSFHSDNHALSIASITTIPVSILNLCFYDMFYWWVPTCLYLISLGFVSVCFRVSFQSDEVQPKCVITTNQ